DLAAGPRIGGLDILTRPDAHAPGTEHTVSRSHLPPTSLLATLLARLLLGLLATLCHRVLLWLVRPFAPRARPCHERPAHAARSLYYRNGRAPRLSGRAKTASGHAS